MDVGERVVLVGVTVSLAALRRAPELYVDLLERARRTHENALCCCTTPAQRLVIRRRGDRFHLACWPEGGHLHDVECSFHRAHHDWSGRNRYEAAITDAGAETHVKLRDALELSIAASHRPRRAAARPSPSVAPSRAALGLTGLLHYLWESAGLNVSTSRAARWRDCWERLDETVGITLVEEHRCLNSVLYVVPPFAPSSAKPVEAGLDRFLHRLGRHGAVERRGLLLGEIKSIAQSTHDLRLQLRHLRPAVFVPASTLSRLERSFRSAFSDRAADSARRIALALVERTSHGNLRVLDASVMLTDEDYIPADSSHEITMSGWLRGHGRRFVKPMRYDQGDEVFPDFVLIDTDPPTMVEVWGVRGRESYELRKQAKQLFYAARAGSVIEWTVGEPLPIVERR